MSEAFTKRSIRGTSAPLNAGPTDTVASSNRAASIVPVSAIEVYQAPGVSMIGGLTLYYGARDSDTLGSREAAELGLLLGRLAIPAGARVKSLYMWTDGEDGTVLGLFLRLTTGERLDLSAGRRLEHASLVLVDGALGTGLLLGAAAAEAPGSRLVAALSFSLLRQPASAAMAIDMPAIDMGSLLFTPQASIRSSISVAGGGQATCPDFSVEVTRVTAYQQPSSAQYYQQLLASLGAAQASEAARQAAALQWSSSYTLPSGGTRTEQWTGQVADLFADQGSLTSETGVTTRMSAPKVSFAVPAGRRAKCAFLYSTLSIEIPYTITAWLGFDDEGGSAWNMTLRGRYATVSATNMDTVVTFEDDTGAKSGERAGPAPLCACQSRA
jgi:hypothetical protein